MCFGAFPGNSGVAASSESPSLKSWTGAARFRSRSRSISANLGLQIDCVQGVPVNVRSLGSAVSRLHISPLNTVKPVDIALTSNAAQVAGLGRIFIGLCLRLSPDRTRKRPAITPGPHLYLHLIIRFLFSYTG